MKKDQKRPRYDLAWKRKTNITHFLCIASNKSFFSKKSDQEEERSNIIYVHHFQESFFFYDKKILLLYDFFLFFTKINQPYFYKIFEARHRFFTNYLVYNKPTVVTTVFVLILRLHWSWPQNNIEAGEHITIWHTLVNKITTNTYKRGISLKSYIGGYRV